MRQRTLPKRTLATRMLSEERRHAARQSRCALAHARDSRHGCSRVAVPSRTLATRMPSEECRHAAQQSRCALAYARDADALRRMHAAQPSRIVQLRFDAAEPRALDGPSLARRRTPSPLIPSAIYGIIYEFSDFWAQFWTIFKSTRPPSKS